MPDQDNATTNQPGVKPPLQKTPSGKLPSSSPLDPSASTQKQTRDTTDAPAPAAPDASTAPPPPIVEEQPSVGAISSTQDVPPLPEDGGGADSPPPLEVPPVVTTPGGKPKKKIGKKVIATILGILFLVGGVGAGVILVQQQQEIREKAAILRACKVCSNNVCVSQNPPCIPDINECASNSDCAAPVTCDGKSPGDCVGGGRPYRWKYPAPGGVNKCYQEFDNSCATQPPPEEKPPSEPPPEEKPANCSVGFKTWGTCDVSCKGYVHKLSECQLGAKNWLCTGKQWQPNYADPGDCKGSCPWTLTNGQCCPTSPDNCDKPGSKICIEDPFVSECTLWDNNCPSGQKYYWKAIAWSENYDALVEQYCRPKPSLPPETRIRASCLNIRAFDADWNEITSQLSILKPGDIVRFTVAGTTTAGSIDKARFTINGTQRPEVTQKRPGTEEFYDEYTVPEGITSFTVGVQLHHTDPSVGWF